MSESGELPASIARMNLSSRAAIAWSDHWSTSGALAELAQAETISVEGHPPSYRAP